MIVIGSVQQCGAQVNKGKKWDETSYKYNNKVPSLHGVHFSGNVHVLGPYCTRRFFLAESPGKVSEQNRSATKWGTVQTTNSLIHVVGMEISPLRGKFKPAIVKKGNVLWSSPKNELLIHNNTCCTFLKMCNQVKNPMVPYKSFSSPLPRLQAQQTIKCHPCDKNGPPL